MRRGSISSVLFLAALIATGGEATLHHSPPARHSLGNAGAVSPQHPSLLTDLTRSRIVEVALTASEVQLPLLPGRSTAVYAYNGSVPGPTLEFREGDRVIVRFRNDLPEPTTVHWHGIHLPFDSDGSPFHPVPPGEERRYEFSLLPGSAGTYWYHPHPHHATAQQVARGLFGAIIVRAPDDPLPASLTERVLILSDNRFLPDGSIDLPDPSTAQGRVDFENGREGDVLFVNGDVLPTLSIRAGEVQRWRVLNASAGRYYRLALEGHTLLHVGSDGGLFGRAVEVEEILIAPAERVELLVRGSASRGSRATLSTLPYDRYIRQTRPADWDQPRALLTLHFTDDEPLPPLELPEILRPVPRIDPATANATRLMVLSQGMINNQLMDMGRVDVRSEVGRTEIWELENIVGMDHPFHLHGFQFQVLERDGVPEPFPSWKDTVNVPRHSTARFIVRYENHPGRWMFHCHVLDHEDHGMMGVLEVL